MRLVILIRITSPPIFWLRSVSYRNQEASQWGSERNNMETETITKTKQCSRCHQDYPATTEFFYSDQRLKSGLASWCKKCCREHQREDKVWKHTLLAGEIAFYRQKYPTHTGEFKRCRKCRNFFPDTPEFFVDAPYCPTCLEQITTKRIKQFSPEYQAFLDKQAETQYPE